MDLLVSLTLPGPARRVEEGEAGDGSDQIVQNLHENKNRVGPGHHLLD